MARSLVGYIGLGATLIFALPAVLLGVDYLVRGRTTWGVALIAVGVLMIAVEEHLTTPSDVPSLVAERTVGRLATGSDAEDEE